MSFFRQTTTIYTLAAACIVVVGFAIAIIFGGPAPIAALPSINLPFKGLDYSTLPAMQYYKSRDGQNLAYRHYPSRLFTQAESAATEKSAIKPIRVVLIHGSSASSKSMHTMAQSLASAGLTVDVLDMRGHGESGVRGQIAYIGQLEDDVTDFVKTVPHIGINTLIGFSSGGGFALRYAASAQSNLFDRYILLAPFLIQAPTNRPSSNGKWASIGLPRIIALSILNDFGITYWNDLSSTEFALNDEAKKHLTHSYSFAVTMNFAAHRDYASDISKSKSPLKLLVGADDELIFADRYDTLFNEAGRSIPITILPATSHIGLTIHPAALKELASAVIY